MRYVVLILLLAFAILGALYLITITGPEYIGGVDRARTIQTSLETISRPLWDFARPLLQLAFILLILESISKRVGIHWSFEGLGITWDIRALIAIIVVIAFSIAALSGSPASEALKEVALVVIGFYFGGLERLQLARLRSGQPAEATDSSLPSVGSHP